MSAKITAEMRAKLRAPLPEEAVSPHPTKTYLSSIKSIYVTERINDVFGVGSWTLKGEVIERLEKFVVVKAILEIPEYGFYGEAYGGNDNVDIGDAYKGATTDGLTKIAGQQLEIGIDVFKGLRTGKEPKPATKPSPDPPQPKSTEDESSNIDMVWLKESLETLKKLEAWSEKNLLSFMKTSYKVEAKTVLEAVEKISKNQLNHFVNKVQEVIEHLQ